jgi:hypothetical protein
VHVVTLASQELGDPVLIKVAGVISGRGDLHAIFFRAGRSAARRRERDPI